MTACSCDFLPSAKIKNIIQTEDAKAKLLAEQRNKKKDHGTSFVPTNIAVNYVQHNRCECFWSVHTRIWEGHERWMVGLIRNVFSQSIMRMWTHHRGTTDTERSPRPGHCVWETLRNQVQRVRDCFLQAHWNKSISSCTCLYKLSSIGDLIWNIVNTNSLTASYRFSETYNLIYTFFCYSTASSPPNYRKRPNNEKATDDYHYEKFKKMNRRYWGAGYFF